MNTSIELNLISALMKKEPDDLDQYRKRKKEDESLIEFYK